MASCRNCNAPDALGENDDVSGNENNITAENFARQTTAQFGAE